MANDHIDIDVTAAGGKAQELKQMPDGLERVAQVLGTIKLQMESRIAGSDYSAIAADYGVSEGNAEAVYNLVAGAHTELTTNANLVQFMKRLG